MSETSQKPPYQEINDQFIKILTDRDSPLIYSFRSGELMAPINGVSGKPYSGPNHLLLSLCDLDPRWYTKKQILDSGYQLREGAQGRKAVYWQFKETRPVLDEQGQAAMDENGQAVMETVPLAQPRMKLYTLYPAYEILQENGLALPLYKNPAKAFDLTRLSRIVDGSGIKIEHDQRNISFYRLNDDSIHIMPADAYPDRQTYASELLKELIRASRHQRRLSRPCGPHGSEGYAKEELRVVLAHMMLAQELNLPFYPDKNESYIKTWSEILRKDPLALALASRDAGLIKEYIMGLEQRREVGQEKIDPLYTITAFRRVGSADGDQPRPWMKAEDDDKALFFGVHSNKDGSIAATYAVEELRQAEEKMTALNRANAMEYTPPAPLTSNEKIFLKVHYMHKDIVKALGASWDNGQKSWCARPGTDLDMLSRWIPAEKRLEISSQAKENGIIIAEIAAENTWLNVPYKDKDAAKALGVKWDIEAKLWYAPAGTDLNQVGKWIPEKMPTPARTMTPEDEFAQALEKAGLKVGGSPVMDGKIYRVQVEGGKAGSLDGAYSAHLDGRPNGWIQNYKTGEKTKWIATGQVLTEEQKIALKLEAAEKVAKREVERQEKEERAIANAREKWNKAMSPYLMGNTYMELKGIQMMRREGLHMDEKGNLLVPLLDADRKLRSIQTITPKGSKQFEKGCPKSGAMHIAGHFREDGGPAGLRDIKSPKIYLCEGYATGVSIYLATEIPVVMAFDAGNIKAVATAIREIHPEADITICADNDHKTEKNTGLEKAQEAAQAVGAQVVCPEFTEAEMANGLTDFNDLHQSRGLGAVREVFQQQRRTLGKVASQVKTAVNKASLKSAGLEM